MTLSCKPPSPMMVPLREQEGGMLQEFKAFISRGNVVDLAVGVIIGTAFTAIVNSLVSDLLMPIIGLLTGGVDFTNWFVNLSGTKHPTLAEAQKAGAATLNYGVFLNAIIRFLIIAWAVFWMIKGMNRLMALRRREETAAPPPAPPADVQLLTEIRDLLKARA
jgi:large conductance mechanosensitive channel